MISDTKTRLALVLAVVTIAAACGGMADKPADKAAPAQGSSTVAAGDFGVPQCDEFISKYMACIDSKVPEGAKMALKSALDQTKAAWKQAAATPQGKEGLVQACTQMLAQTKTATAMYGCQW